MPLDCLIGVFGLRPHILWRWDSGALRVGLDLVN